MKHRPWPIVILAGLHFLAPIGSVLLGSHLSGVALIPYIQALFRQETPLGLFEIFCLFPLAGAAVYAMKAWSYSAYFLIMASSFFTLFESWKEFPNHFTLPLLFGTYLVNLGLVSYFLLPNIRVGYLNRKLRWWEAKPRYAIEIPAEVEALDGPDSKGAVFGAQIRNVSVGGLMLQIPAPKDSPVLSMVPGQEIRVRWVFFGIRYEVGTRIVYRKRETSPLALSLGVQLTERSAPVRKLVAGLRMIGLPQTFERVSGKESFLDWAKSGIHKPQAWIPQWGARTIAAPTESDSTPSASPKKAA